MIDAKIPEKSARQSLGGLLKELPDRISRLISSEIQLAKLEVLTKAKAAGVGAGMLAAAAFFALVAFAVLVAAAIMGLANVVPDWLAAIIVAVVFLLLAFVLALLGVKKLKKGIPPVPEDSLDSMKADVRAVTGKD